MKVDIQNLQEIFGPEVQFRVPLFQRRYVWDRQDQWEPLWEDIVSVVRQIESGQKLSPHFMGAVVVVQQPNPVGTLGIRETVDGQQRLTTLQLLISAIESISNDLNPRPEQELLYKARVRLHKLRTNNEELFEGDDLFKVLPTNIDRVPFRTALSSDSETKPAEASTNIVRAYNWFRHTAKVWIDECSIDLRDHRIDHLVTALTLGLNVAVIDLDQADDEQAIFETLNSRGAPLMVSDLVKNHLLRRCQDQGENPDRLYNEHWKQFDSETWSGKKGRKIDDFLFRWTCMESVPLISERHLFREFRTLTKDRDLHNLVLSLNNAADSYTYFLDSPIDQFSRQGVFLDRWRSANLHVLLPLLLWLKVNEPQIGSEEVTKSLEHIESWFMRRIILGGTAMGYFRFVHQLLAAIKRRSGSNVSEVVATSLMANTSQDLIWPEDSEIRFQLLYSRTFTRLRRARLRIVFEAFEDHLIARHGKTEYKFCPKDLTIEHLLPQGWTENSWPLLPLEFYQSHGTERNDFIHTIGNLTLVNEKLNPEMSNHSWNYKREALEAHSGLYLNRELVEAKEWNEQSILERSEALATLICQIWPRPSN